MKLPSPLRLVSAPFVAPQQRWHQQRVSAWPIRPHPAEDIDIACVMMSFWGSIVFISENLYNCIFLLGSFANLCNFFLFVLTLRAGLSQCLGQDICRCHLLIALTAICKHGRPVLGGLWVWLCLCFLQYMQGWISIVGKLQLCCDMLAGGPVEPMFMFSFPARAQCFWAP